VNRLAKPGAILVGGGGHAVSCYDNLLANGYTSIKVNSIRPPITPPLCTLEYIACIPKLSIDSRVHIFLAIGDNYKRQSILLNEFKQPNLLSLFPSLVHPTAYVAHGASIGPGTIVFPNSSIGCMANVGMFSIVNTSASLDHDSNLGDFSSLAPGSRIGGSCKIGDRVFIGLGASIVHNISVSDDTVIGAHSLVVSDVPKNVLGYGVPFKIIRNRNSSDPYL
jgi:sugar O-acyltransferase (sialic acid O-acetyltransferase NeuD family)